MRCYLRDVAGTPFGRKSVLGSRKLETRSRMYSTTKVVFLCHTSRNIVQSWYNGYARYYIIPNVLHSYVFKSLGYNSNTSNAPPINSCYTAHISTSLIESRHGKSHHDCPCHRLRDNPGCLARVQLAITGEETRDSQSRKVIHQPSYWRQVCLFVHSCDISSLVPANISFP